MAKAKLAITMDSTLLSSLDKWVAEGDAKNRSNAIEAAVRDYLRRRRSSRYARELSKLDAAEERAFAEEGLGGSGPWPDPY